MNRNRLFLLLSFLAISILILSACAPTSGATAVDPTASTNPCRTPACAPCPICPEAKITLTEQDAGKTIYVRQGETLAVTLDGNITTGFTWELASTENSLITLTGGPEYKADGSQLGSPGKITLTFKAVSIGQQVFNLVYHQPFEKTTPPEKTFEVTLFVTGENGALPLAPETTKALTPGATPTTVVHPTNGWKGWQVYTNTAYGFTFQYPPDWKLEETRNTAKSPNTLNGHAVWLIPNSDNDVLLQIAFKRTSEDIMIQRTGVGSGDLISWGKVLFLGAEIERSVLVARGLHMTVMYTGPGVIQRGDLQFTFNLDYLDSNPQTGLSDVVEANADSIVASFQLEK